MQKMKTNYQDMEHLIEDMYLNLTDQIRQNQFVSDNEVFLLFNEQKPSKEEWELYSALAYRVSLTIEQIDEDISMRLPNEREFRSYDYRFHSDVAYSEDGEYRPMTYQELLNEFENLILEF